MSLYIFQLIYFSYLSSLESCQMVVSLLSLAMVVLCSLPLIYPSITVVWMAKNKTITFFKILHLHNIYSKENLKGITTFFFLVWKPHVNLCDIYHVTHIALTLSSILRPRHLQPPLKPIAARSCNHRFPHLHLLKHNHCTKVRVSHTNPKGFWGLFNHPSLWSPTTIHFEGD